MTDNKTVLQALSLINECYKCKMDLTTNRDKESKEPDYDEGKNQLEEKQEEEAREQITANHAF